MKIKGNTVGTPMPRTNYNQTDPTKADYLVGRENIMSAEELKKYVDDKLKDVGGSGGGGGTGEGGVGEIPKTLPNPHAITFKGAVNATYDGSEAVEVEIPKGESGGLSTLIVTGSPKCESIMMGGTNFAVYTAPLFTSHTTKEIVDAFNAGRYVHILLKNPMPMMWLGTSTVLPDISYIEASVVSAVAGMNAVEAVGTGYCTNGDKTYSVKISVTGNNKPQITAHLFNAYDPNVATKTDVNNALKNVAYTNDIDELKAYINEALGGDGY